MLSEALSTAKVWPGIPMLEQLANMGRLIGYTRIVTELSLSVGPGVPLTSETRTTMAILPC